jgi:trk system potassium uptake protein
MKTRLSRLPLFVLLMGAVSLAMLVPAVHAGLSGAPAVARTFFYGMIIGLALTVMVGMATRGYAPASVVRSQLTALVAAFLALPVLMALPFWMLAPGGTLTGAWFEMVSSFTTTGATLWDNPARLHPSLHLWRALVGWLGGALTWIAAISVLAPLNLGGFEVRRPGQAGAGIRATVSGPRPSDPATRMMAHALQLLPVYAGLTAIIWAAQVIAGEGAFVALCHAMSVLSTSGISPIGGVQEGAGGIAVEAVLLIAMIFALSHLTYSRRADQRESLPWLRDPELGLGLVLILSVTALLFLRHFVLAYDDAAISADRALLALWGTLFTVTSFLTTTGFESQAWLGAADWSGMTTHGLLLAGLAIIGGGVATTAGGVKLLRVYALVRLGERELERLVQPSSVGGSGTEARRLRRQGAYIAWIAFTLFTLSVMGTMLLLALTGIDFERAMVLSVAAMSNTGPLAQIATESPISFAVISETGQVILALAMVLGRLEMLALIALFNPDFWRN